jgi:hypothetical protein
MKRIVVATLFGLVAGALCASGAFYGHLLKFSVVTLVFILLNRAVMGFAIGISGLNLRWGWNGIFLGIAVGSIFSYFMFMTNGPGPMPVVNFFVNGIFGLMIEFFTTVVFKQPALATVRPVGRPVSA